MADRKSVIEGVEKLLRQVDELEKLVGNFEGDNSALHLKINEYIASLKDLHTVAGSFRQSSGQPYGIPIELVKYIDDGGNPDMFVADVFRSCVAANEASNGKVTAIRNFKDHLTSHLQQTMPDLVEQYQTLRKSTPGSNTAAPS